MTDDEDDGWLTYHGEDFEKKPAPKGKRPRKADDGYDCGSVEVIRTTDNALLVRGSGLSADPFGVADPNEESWIPRSQVHSAGEITHDAQKGDVGKLFISTWFAGERGLV